jgi:hypothetical protein
VFLGLNPSTADETRDDPTARRCVAFARRWGLGGLILVNLFAFRATDPDVLMKAPDPIGPDNDRWLRHYAARSQRIVAAWGLHGSFRERDRTVVELRCQRCDGREKRLGDALWCLGYTQDGRHPRHPLYLPKTTRLRRFLLRDTRSTSSA